MRNNNSRPHESSSSKFQSNTDTNYAAARNKRSLKGSPIPIPQGPNHDSSHLRIISRMKRKDGLSLRDTVRTQTKNIPTRSSNRLQPRKKKEQDVIEINSDEEEQPMRRKRRIIERDSESEEEDEKPDTSVKDHKMAVANRLRKERLEKEKQERLQVKRKEQEKDTQEFERREEERNVKRKLLDKRKSEQGRRLDNPKGENKDFSGIQNLLSKIQAEAVSVSLPSSNISLERRKRLAEEIKEDTVIPSRPFKSYIDQKKDTARAGLIKRLGVNSDMELSPKTLTAPRIPIYKPRDPFRESQKTRILPTLTESVHKTSSIYNLPDSLDPELASLIKKSNKIEVEEEDEDEEEENEKEKPIEEKEPVQDRIKSPPYEEEKPKLAYDPIDDETVQPIGVDKHLLTYPFEGKKSVTIYERDLERLEEDQFLNDSLLDIFPKIWADKYPQSSTHTFSSFFYTKLAGDGSTVNYDKIGRWTANINIFEKKLIIIPIAQNHHWYLVVVTNPGLCIKNPTDYGLKVDQVVDEDEKMDESDVIGLKVPGRPGRKVKSLKAGAILDRKRPYIMILDALGGSKFETCKNTSEYLKKEAMHKLNIKEEDFVEPEFVYTDCPNQKNFVDCGVFCLHYMKSLYEHTERMMDVLYNNLKGDKGWDIENTLPNFRLILKRILKKNMVQYREYLRKTIDS